MERKTLNQLTRIAFISALITLFFIPIPVYLSSLITHGWLTSAFSTLALIGFLLSVINIPISILSMFSKAHLFKRCFALVVNVSPLTVIMIAFVIEFINEFSSTPV